ETCFGTAVVIAGGGRVEADRFVEVAEGLLEVAFAVMADAPHVVERRRPPQADQLVVVGNGDVEFALVRPGDGAGVSPLGDLRILLDLAREIFDRVVERNYVAF